MCGIAGHITFQTTPSAENIAELVRRIRHRGPDHQQLWSSPTGLCILGHARLSIIDLSPLGHQPMLDPITGNCIVFNGEIYNFQVLRRQCEAEGDRFRSRSDTEVILALYRRYGIACLEKLRGMFAFAIWDEERQQLFFARDRVGKKPFHYAFVSGNFIFGSEIGPLAGHPLVSRDLDLEALELYLQLQYIPAPWTIYTGIRKLLPAHYGIFDRQGLRLEQYWDVDYRQKIQLSEDEALEGLEEKLTEAVRLRMIADVPLGALLSGGVDSSLVVALMAKLGGSPIRSFSIGFQEEAFNELPFAQQAADICQTLHQPEIVYGNVEQLLPQLVKQYGEPYADSSAVPSFLVCQTARRHVTVALNGDGGDELLGGYERYWLPPAAFSWAPRFGDFIPPHQAVSWATTLLTAKSLPGRVGCKLLMEFARPDLRSVFMYGIFWNDKARAELLNENKYSYLLPQWRSQWYARACQKARDPIDRMLWYDNHTYLAGDLLVKMDIASMHCGLETRSPLLDHEVIEYCACLPTTYKVKNRVGKYLLKKLARRFFPADFVYRPKMGFGIPLADWLRGPLHKIMHQILNDPAIMSPLSMTVVKKTLQEFEAGLQSHEFRLWTLLMFGVWRRMELS